ncbi:DUF2155 domain-containing protein [Methylocystis suflitae]|uniref:DUF2155 domain-containing protein n=1 Tax=Methylocystis suflitae TaxID=2951405 RepID=UPI00210C921C|nr:DUF2155 domain-containing protein [Methylocystis suflitae]MCQ4191685.1 DUF2155 domain-containing protein [Methylocystis suflitae]
MKLPLSLAPAAVGAWAFFAVAASAEPIRHPTAIFAGLDKTTGRIINFDVAIDETVQFGTLQVTPRVCNTRPQTETPQTTSFVEVDELIVKPERRGDPKPETVKTDAKQEAKRIFSGWMFAASPGLHGVEHPVYDVWLVDCKGGKETVAPPAEAAAPAAPPAEAEATAPSEGTSGKKRRSRRVEPTAPPPMENQPIGPADQAAPAPVEPEAAPAPAEDPASQTGGRKKKRRRAEQANPAAAPPASNPLFPF